MIPYTSLVEVNKTVDLYFFASLRILYVPRILVSIVSIDFLILNWAS